MNAASEPACVPRVTPKAVALEVGLTLVEVVIVGAPCHLLARSAPPSPVSLERALVPLLVLFWGLALWRVWAELRPVAMLRRAKLRNEPVSASEAEAARRAFRRAPLASGGLHAAGWVVVAVVAVFVGLRRGSALPTPTALGLLGATALHAAALGALRALLLGRLLARLRPVLLPNVEPIRLFSRTYRGNLILVGLACLGGAHAALTLFVAAFTAFDAAALSALGLTAWPVLVPAAALWTRSLWRRTGAIEAYFAGTLRGAGTRGPARDDPRAVTAFQVAQGLPYRLAANHAFSVALAAVLAAAAGRRVFAFSPAATSRFVAATAVVVVADYLYTVLFVRQALRPLMRHVGSRHHLPIGAVRSRVGLQTKLYALVVAVVAIGCGVVALYLESSRDPVLAPLSLLVGLALLAGLTVSFVRELVSPIAGLESRSEEMSRGELARPVAPAGEADEIGRLSVAFEEMRRALRDRLRSTESINVDLEREVRRRTEALEQRNTELREALDKLRRAQDNLVRSEKLASMGRLVAGIAHEINNPVNAVINTLGPLEETVQELSRVAGASHALGSHAEPHALGRDAEEMLGVVKRGAGRTKAIVQALHNYSRGEDAAPRDVNLARSVDDSVDLLRHRLRDVRIVKDIDPGARLQGFPGQIDQVLMNLVTNAAQAMGDRGGTIRIAAAAVPGGIELSVADDGPGIPPEILPRIFDPFFTTKDVGEGAGLGLSIVHGIVERHGGTIDVDSAPGRGTTFRMRFPAAAAQAQPSGVA